MRKLTLNVPLKNKKKKEKVIMVTAKDCEACEELMKDGLCKKVQCVDIFSKRGKELDKLADIDSFPFCLVELPNGKVRNCTKKEENKFNPE